MAPLVLGTVRRRLMTPPTRGLGWCFRAYFRIEGPYSSVSPHAVVAVSSSPRSQACLNVVDGMPNSFDAAVSLQYLLAFFTWLLQNATQNPRNRLPTIVAFTFWGSGRMQAPVLCGPAALFDAVIIEKLDEARKFRKCSFLLRRVTPRHPAIYSFERRADSPQHFGKAL